MAAKLTRLTHGIALQLHLLVGSCIICSSRSRWILPRTYFDHELQEVVQVTSLATLFSERA